MILIRQETWKKDCIAFCKIGMLIIMLSVLVQSAHGISIIEISKEMQEGRQENIIFALEEPLDEIQIQVDCQEEKRLIFNKPVVLIDEKNERYLSSFTIDKGFLEEDSKNCSITMVSEKTGVVPSSIKDIEIKRKRNVVEWVQHIFTAIIKAFRVQKENSI